MDAFLSWVVSNVIFAGLIALAAFIVGRCFRNPHLAHGLWLLVLIKLLTPPVFVLETTWFQEPEASAEPAAHPATMEPIADEETRSEFINPEAELPSHLPEKAVADMVIEENHAPAISTEPVLAPPSVPDASNGISFDHRLLWLWGLGSVVCAGLVIAKSRQFQRMLPHAIEVDEGLQIEIDRLSRVLGMKRSPSVFLIEAAIPPLVWGAFRRPRILLPAKLFEELRPRERQTVLAHELAHIRRGDHLFRWIEVAALVFFWWNPIAWWAGREMRRAEEECCDALVIWALPEARQCYGRALSKTVEFLAETRLPIPHIVGGTLGAPLKRRIEMILNENIHHKMSWRAWGAMLLIAMASLPVVAQNQAPESDSKKQESGAPSTETPSALPGEKQETPIDSSLPDEKRELPKTPPQKPGEELPRTQPRDKANGEKVSAQLKPMTDLTLSSIHSGTVLNVHIIEGQEVKKGDVLIELRNTEMDIRRQEALGEVAVQKEMLKSAELAVPGAKAALIPAVQKLEFSERLSEKGVVAQSQLQADRARVEQAQIELQKAESEVKTASVKLATAERQAELAARLVEELTIRAPTDGIVLNLFAKMGELVKATAPVGRIVSQKPLIAEAHVQNLEVRVGQAVEVEVPMSKHLVRRFPGKVTFVSPFREPVGRTTLIRCVFNNAGPDGQPLVQAGQQAYIMLPAKE